MATERDRIIWRNVSSLLSEKRWNLTELARAMGSTPQAVNSIKNGTRGIGPVTLRKLAKAFNIDEIKLLSVEVPERRQKLIPVISWIQAGFFAENTDIWPPGVSGEGEPVRSFKAVGPNAFGLRVEGDSMAPRFLTGDVIVVDPGITCDNGSPCVVMLNGEVTFKIFRETEESIILEPTNNKYPEITIRKDSKVDFKVIGKVVDLVAKF